MAPPPPWMPCPCCDEFLCTIHRMHAADCPCPPIDEWGDVDPYAAPPDPGPRRRRPLRLPRPPRRGQLRPRDTSE